MILPFTGDAVATTIPKVVDHLRSGGLIGYPTETVYVAWDNASTHEDDEVEAVLRGAAGRLVLMYLPTYSPWLNPIEMLWRQFRREVTHCELFAGIDALVEATRAFFGRYNRTPGGVCSIIGAPHAT